MYKNKTPSPQGKNKKRLRDAFGFFKSPLIVKKTRVSSPKPQAPQKYEDQYLSIQEACLKHYHELMESSAKVLGSRLDNFVRIIRTHSDNLENLSKNLQESPHEDEDTRATIRESIEAQEPILEEYSSHLNNLAAKLTKSQGAPLTLKQFSEPLTIYEGGLQKLLTRLEIKDHTKTDLYAQIYSAYNLLNNWKSMKTVLMNCAQYYEFAQIPVEQRLPISDENLLELLEHVLTCSEDAEQLVNDITEKYSVEIKKLWVSFSPAQREQYNSQFQVEHAHQSQSFEKAMLAQQHSMPEIFVEECRQTILARATSR